MILVVIMVMTAVAVPIMVLMARYVFAVVPIVAHEVHGTTAGLVFAAVP
jgi:hypothetical protein